MTKGSLKIAAKTATTAEQTPPEESEIPSSSVADALTSQEQSLPTSGGVYQLIDGVRTKVD